MLFEVQNRFYLQDKTTAMIMLFMLYSLQLCLIKKIL